VPGFAALVAVTAVAFTAPTAGILSSTARFRHLNTNGLAEDLLAVEVTNRVIGIPSVVEFHVPKPWWLARNPHACKGWKATEEVFQVALLRLGVQVPDINP